MNSERSNESATRRFSDFFNHSIAFVITLATATPVFAEYFGLMDLSNFIDDDKAKFYKFSSCGLSALTMISIFWIRHKISRSIFLLYGGTVAICGFWLLAYVKEGIVQSPYTIALYYMFGFASLTGGAMLTALFGFSRHQEREAFLFDFAPSLDEREWRRLQSCAQSMIRARRIAEEMNESAELKSAYLNGLLVVESSIEEEWSATECGILKIRGPAMNGVFGNLCKGVTKTFRAISLDDLDFWRALLLMYI